MDAFGMIEVNSIAVGIEVGDVMLKTAGVRLVSAQPVCCGKYILMVQGGVAEVRSSVEAGLKVSKECLIDSLIIPNVHHQVFSALSCASETGGKGALGVIEAFSLTASILASDAAVKAADVDLIEIRLGRGLGGKSFVILTGDVSAVRFSIETAVSNQQSEGMIARTIVIPSPSPELMKALL